jgi:hypothetical protein
MESSTPDWLVDDGASATEARAASIRKGLGFAELYTVFDSGPGKMLLEHWVKEIENRDLPPNASHAEYAYFEGRRAFVRGIQRQIKFAKNPGDLPE